MNKKWIGCVAALLMGSQLLCAQPGSLPRQEDAACKQWVDGTIARMSVKEKVGQLFVYVLPSKFNGTMKKEVQQLATQNGVGGLLFTEGTIVDQARLTNIGQAAAKVPLLIASDADGGLSTRLQGAPVFPRNAALGCVTQPRLLEEYDTEIAREFKEMGMQVNFLPTVSYGHAPLDSTTLYSFRNIARPAGVGNLLFLDATTLKEGTESATSVVDALKAGADIVVIRKDIDHWQKTVNKAIETGVLTTGEIETKCRRMLTYKYLLGLDIRPSVSLRNLEERMNTADTGPLARQLHLSAITVLGNHSHMLPLTADKQIAVLSVGGNDADKTFVHHFGQLAAMTHFQVTKGTPDAERKEIVSKLNTYQRVVVSVTLKDWEAWDYSAFFESLSLRVPVVYVFFTTYPALVPLEGSLEKASAVVLAHSAEDDVQEQVAGLLFARVEAHGKLATGIGSLYRKGDGSVVTPGMKPCVQPEDCGMKGYVLSRIDSIVAGGLKTGAYPGCQVLVLKNGVPLYDKCFGTFSDKDRRPVTPEGIYDLGAVSKSAGTLLAVMKLYDEGKLKLTDKVSQFLPWLRNSNKKDITVNDLLHNESGMLPYIRFYRDAIDDTSVTGPFTQGFVDEWHYTRMGEYTYACSDFKFKKGLFTASKTATHSLHVADGMWLANSFRNTIQNSIASSEMGSKRFLESDLDFILLQQIVESVAGQPMDEYLSAAFYTPMGLTRTLYRPLQRHDKSAILPTACNDYLRRQDLCGYVLDEAAAFMGGVAGNAGLFSTAHELGNLFQMLLSGGEWNGKRYLNESTCRLFLTDKSAISHYGLGFDKPNMQEPKLSHCSPSTPESVVGQRGFTGTCVWVDPATELVYVFLSNRVCPDVWNARIIDTKLTQSIQEIIFQSMKSFSNP